MNTLLKTGRIFFGLGIIAYGVQQVVIRDFRPQMIPVFPVWVHQYSIFPIITGIAMIILGAVITGLLKLKFLQPDKVCLYLGIYFLALMITCQIPYLLFVYPHKLSHLGSWADLLKELAFCGGAFIMTTSYVKNQPAIHLTSTAPATQQNESTSTHYPVWLFTLGRVFYCTTLILFGRSHFIYNEFIATMVPRWMGMPVFWTYFGGVALIGAGIAIMLNLFLRPVALLLAIMLFLWFAMLHVPGAISDPVSGRGNLIVSAFDALLYCGVALALSTFKKQPRKEVPETASPAEAIKATRLQV